MFSPKKLKKEKFIYCKNKFGKFSSDRRKNWKLVNRILNRNRRGDGVDTSDPVVISDLFVDYFSSVAHNLDRNIPVSNTDPMDYMPNPNRNAFIAQSTNRPEVIEIVMKMSNKGHNIKSIPIFIFKKIIHSITDIFVDIFNSSVDEGKFPKRLKQSRIAPIYKIKNSIVVNNYRPISVLSTVSND